MCPACVDGLEVHLGDVPALVEDLEVAAQKRDRVTVAARRARVAPESPRVLDGQWWTDDPSSGLLRDSGDDATVTSERVAADAARRMAAVLGRTRPDRKAAADALDALHAELVSSVRALLDPIGKIYDGDPSSVGLSRWLLRHVRSVGLSPAGPDVVTGMARVHRRAMAIIDNAPERVWYGYCAVEVAGDDGRVIECGEEVSVPRGQVQWTCPGCGSVYLAAELEDARIEAARDKLLTVRELAIFAGRKPDTMKHWLARRGITPRGRASDGAALYRAGDYFDAQGCSA